VKILAVTTAKRSPYLPDIPTLKESGIDVEADAWNGLIAPAGTPEPVVARIRREVIEAIESKGIRDKLAAQLMEPTGSTPDEFRAKIEAEIAQLQAAADVIRNRMARSGHTPVSPGGPGR
jgi:tripartite-type tricarboxylate transporter receptor subunit TctC